MCGIVGYIGPKRAAPILLEALKRVEYRGYDSAGMATLDDGIHVKKDMGKIPEIHGRLNFLELPGTIGIGHTRWATHGEPSQVNAHPHLDSDEIVAVVHNGVIENYLELKRYLEKRGHKFSSETDSEVIPNLIASFMKVGKNLEEAVRRATSKLNGSYAILVISAREPGKIICVRKESPLILGVGKGEMFIASDIPAVLPWTKEVVVLEEEDMATVTEKGALIKNFRTGRIVRRKISEITWTVEMAEKQGYPHFTLKEIFQQPEAVRETMRAGREEMDALIKMMSRASQVYFAACGTSYHAALVGKYALKKLAGLPVEAVISSEFPESCHVNEKTLVFAITQSGETADTIRAARVAKAGGAKLACLTNVVGSSITRESDLSCYTFAGPEISVVATKTFAAQVAYLLLLSARAAEEKKIEKELSRTPGLIREVLREVMPTTKKLARKWWQKNDIYLIGRGIGYPIILEGALKLKEITYTHSEGMPAGELKHGTLALVENGTPVIAVVQPGETVPKMIGNIEEIKARGAEVVAISSMEEIKQHAHRAIVLPFIDELLSPLLYILPLQLLAYHICVRRGHDPDKPRSLAKSVTVL